MLKIAIKRQNIFRQGKKALLEETKVFTVLSKTPSSSMISDPITKDETFWTLQPLNISKLVITTKRLTHTAQRLKSEISGEKFEEVALTGAVFALQINWFCSFDFGASIQDCLPEYSFARLDNPNAIVSPGFNFRYLITKLSFYVL